MAYAADGLEDARHPAGARRARASGNPGRWRLGQRRRAQPRAAPGRCGHGLRHDRRQHRRGPDAEGTRMSCAGKSLVVGVDVGGTFTDLFVLDEALGTGRIIKVPSTRGEEARGFLHRLARVADSAAAIATIAHVGPGTTVGTTALLERKVARTGIITTRGFRDVLEMRRRDRPQTWGLRGSFLPVV